MNQFNFTMPTKFYVGFGQVNVLREIAGEYGKKALLCADSTMGELGFLEKVKNLLKEAGVEVEVIDDVQPNPKDVDIDRQVAYFLEKGCDFTVGLGGGSSMDTAKAVAFLAAQNDGSVRDYVAGGVKSALEEVKQPYPVICITTTAGTGSEATKWFVVSDTVNHDKPGVGHDLLMPSVSIVDPEFMMSLPANVTRSCGIDVLFHAMEAYVAKCANAFTDMAALEALRLVMKYLGRAIENGKEDREAREGMAWANTLGGIVIGEGNSGTVAIHALGHSIGGQTNAPHGLTMCPLAVPYIERTWRADMEKYANLTRVFGYGEDTMSTEELAALCPEAMRGVLKKFGCDLTMKDLGVTEEMIGPMTDSVFHTMGGVLNNSLVEFTREDVIALYKDAM